MICGKPLESLLLLQIGEEGYFMLPVYLTFRKSGKLGPKREGTDLISASDSGAWPAYWLEGKSRISKPFALYCSYIASSSEYWQLNPQWVALFTIRRTFPL